MPDQKQEAWITAHARVTIPASGKLPTVADVFEALGFLMEKGLGDATLQIREGAGEWFIKAEKEMPTDA